MVLNVLMAFNSKHYQLLDDYIKLLLGSSDNKDSYDDTDLNPCYVENDGETLNDSDEESGSNLSAILGGATNAARNDD